MKDRSNNLFKASMNRIDNTHATFINCLRDWDDPYLHGHKTLKASSCQRCDQCGCKYSTAAATIAAATALAAVSQSSNNSALNSNDRPKKGFQPIIRCRSSNNVPKTINQCIKLAKSRPRPSSIRPHASVTSGLINEAASMMAKRRQGPSTTTSNSSISQFNNLSTQVMRATSMPPSHTCCGSQSNKFRGQIIKTGKKQKPKPKAAENNRELTSVMGFSSKLVLSVRCSPEH